MGHKTIFKNVTKDHSRHDYASTLIATQRRILRFVEVRLQLRAFNENLEDLMKVATSIAYDSSTCNSVAELGLLDKCSRLQGKKTNRRNYSDKATNSHEVCHHAAIMRLPRSVKRPSKQLVPSTRHQGSSGHGRARCHDDQRTLTVSHG